VLLIVEVGVWRDVKVVGVGDVVRCPSWTQIQHFESSHAVLVPMGPEPVHRVPLLCLLTK
jgi:hypothetical protein